MSQFRPFLSLNVPFLAVPLGNCDNVTQNYCTPIQYLNPLDEPTGAWPTGQTVTLWQDLPVISGHSSGYKPTGNSIHWVKVPRGVDPSDTLSFLCVPSGYCFLLLIPGEGGHWGRGADFLGSGGGQGRASVGFGSMAPQTIFYFF